MIVDVIITNLVLLLIYMTAFFAVARKRHRLDTVDTAWGGGFVLIAWATFLQYPSNASLVIALLISIWGFRLAKHILRRSLRHSEDDPRYTAMAEKWQGKNYWLRVYLSIFVLQGILILLVGAPISAVIGEKIKAMAWVMDVGAVVWLIGFIFEMVGDRQLAHFRSDLNNKGKVMDTGLWRLSRHPNYFGEVVQWFGIGIIACQASWGWLGLIGPALLTFLIVKVSGIPPIEKRKASDPNYQEYKQRTSQLIPLPPKSTS